MSVRSSNGVLESRISEIADKHASLVHNLETRQIDMATSKKGWRFWAMFPALCLASLLTALDATVLATALPTISRDLGSSASYVWAINAYTLAVTVVQPLYGQLTNTYGRKPCFVAGLLLFIVGSCVCGAARNTGMLIAGRTVQGVGGAGLNIIPAMVVSDLVPLKERQLYQSLIYAAFAVGTFVGPIIGGALASQWRWIFYLNLPISVCALVLTVLFLRLERIRNRNPWRQLKSLDFLGNAILIASMVAILIALSSARSTPQWRSWHTLVPMLLGFGGTGVFVLWERSTLCKMPTTPIRLFSNQTSAVAFTLTFLHGIAMYWGSYFLPVYFQSVLLASPLQSGINTLPAVIALVPFGVLGAVVISKTGRFRENHVIGFGLTTVGAGCFSLLDENSSTAVWIVLQIVYAAGAGLILTATLTAIQAPLPESDVAVAVATWGFVQSLGFVCGAAIPSNVFNTRFQQLLTGISDGRLRDLLSDGAAYENATRTFMLSLSEDNRRELIQVFVRTLKLVWQVEVAFTGVAVVLSLLLRNVTLRTSLETQYGYRQEPEGGNDDAHRQNNGAETKYIAREQRVPVNVVQSLDRNHRQ